MFSPGKLFWWTDAVKQRTCSFVLEHYLGHFLKEKLTIEQLRIDLYQGTGTVKDVRIDCDAINQRLEDAGIPLEITSGYARSITITVPWSSLVMEDSSLSVDRLEVTIVPKSRHNHGMDVSRLSGSLTTSMQAAEECVRPEDVSKDKLPEGVVAFAQTIDSVFSRLKIDLTETLIRFEAPDPASNGGSALEIWIDRFSYCDEKSTDEPSAASGGSTPSSSPSAAKICKNISLSGLSLHTDRFSQTYKESAAETDAAHIAPSVPDVFHSAHEVITKQPSYISVSKASLPREQETLGSDPVKFARLSGNHKIGVTISPEAEEGQGSQASITCSLGSMAIFIAPAQLKLISEVVDKFTANLTDAKADSSHTYGGAYSGPHGLALGGQPMDDHHMEFVQRDLERQMHRDQVLNHQRGFSQTNVGFPSSANELERARRSHHGYAGDKNADEWPDLPLDGSVDSRMFQSVTGSTHGADPGVTGSDMTSSVTSHSTSSTLRSAANPSVYRFNPAANQPFIANMANQFQGGIGKGAPQGKHPAKGRHSKEGRALSGAPGGPMASVSVTLAHFAGVLLHTSPRETPSDGIDDEGVTAVSKLKKMGALFYDGFSESLMRESQTGTLEELREALRDYCKEDHIKLLGKTIRLDYTQQVTVHGRPNGAGASGFSGQGKRRQTSETAVTATAAMFEITEWIWSNMRGGPLFSLNSHPICTEILTFISPMNTAASMHQSMYDPTNQPCIKLEMKSIESTRKRHGTPTKVNVSVEFCQACCVEVDVSIIDRLQDLLRASPRQQSSQQQAYGQTGGESYSAPDHYTQYASLGAVMREDEEGPIKESMVDISVVCTDSTEVVVRFPVADLRPSSGASDSLPWWRPCLREEKLRLDLTDLSFSTQFVTPDNGAKRAFEITCSEAVGMFESSLSEEPIPFIYVSQQDGPMEMAKGFDVIRLVITMSQPLMQSPFDVDSSGPESSDSLSDIMRPKKSDPSPFSPDRQLYEDTLTTKPGTRSEIDMFSESCKANTNLSIELQIPGANIVIPSQEVLELLYNRVCNDLLLWEPRAPAPKEMGPRFSVLDPAAAALGGFMQDLSIHPDKYAACRAPFGSMGAGYDSDDSESDELPTAMGYSIYSTSPGSKSKRRPPPRTASGQCKTCFELSLGHARAKMYHEVKDENDEVVKGCHGETVVDITDSVLFFVADSHGKPGLSYLSFHSHSCALYHSGKMSRPLPNFGCDIEKVTHSVPSDLDVTLYPSERGVASTMTASESGAQRSRGVWDSGKDALTLTVKIQLNHSRTVKDIIVALTLAETTLQYRQTPWVLSWLNQLMDMFALTDYDVLGYAFPKVVSELHVGIQSCAIDYRPLHIPVVSMVTLDSFRISSTIVIDSPVSVLRFLLEGAALYVSDKCSSKAVSLMRDYVCVLEVEFFDLCLKKTEGKDKRYPRTDLTAACTGVTLRTCADSFSALCQLIMYIAKGGDQQSVTPRQSLRTHDNDRRGSEDGDEDALAGGQESGEVPSYVDNEMEDAMREFGSDAGHFESGTHEYERTTHSPEMFLFPGESPVAPPALDGRDERGGRTGEGDDEEEAEERLNVSTIQPGIGLSDSEDETHDLSHSSGDMDFVIMEHPVMPDDHEPVTESFHPIRLTSDFFAKVHTRADQLLVPPTLDICPVSIYILRDLSLLWVVYGGSDFAPPTTIRNKDGPHNWKVRGGPNRDHSRAMELEISKLAMSVSSYSESSPHVSRECLLVQDVVIQDKLAQSKIRKFLYRYFSDELPRQNVPMVSIKRLTTRADPQPEASARISVQPLKFNIDQDALAFLQDFLSAVSIDNDTAVGGHSDLSRRHQSLRLHERRPVVTFGGSDVGGEGPARYEKLSGRVVFNEMDDEEEEEEEEDDDETVSQPVFYKSFVFSPAVVIVLDYHGKMNSSMGNHYLVGLLVGLAQLNHSQLHLKRLVFVEGVSGTDRLLNMCLKSWLDDLKVRQLPSILGGIGPMHSVVQMFHGIRDLFVLPYEQYQKDGRVVRGLQRGVSAFGVSTSVALLELSGRLVDVVQFAAELTFDFVSPTTRSVQASRKKIRRGKRRPGDIREGANNALEIAKAEITDAAQTTYEAAKVQHEGKGITGAVGAVAQQILPNMIRPIIMATGVTSNLIGGMRNQLQPDARKHEENKWKSDA